MTKKKTVQAQPATDRSNFPDWRNEDGYPKPDDLSLTQWRWEFLRRDEEYRQEWETQLESNHPFRLALKGDHDIGFDIPYYPEEYEERWEDIWRILRKYGLARLLDPSVCHPTDLRFYFVPFRPDLRDIPELKKGEIQTIPLNLKYPYLAWFDLWRPIDPQIEHYRKLLIREQRIAWGLFRNKKTLKQVLQDRKQGIKPELPTWVKAELDASFSSDKNWPGHSHARRDRIPVQEDWPKFLRVLDARSENSSWQSIGVKVLQLKKSYAQASSNAKAVHKAALVMWWKISIERSLGQPLGMEEARWEDSHSVVPTMRGEHSLLFNWLDLLPPRLKTIFLSSLS